MLAVALLLMSFCGQADVQPDTRGEAITGSFAPTFVRIEQDDPAWIHVGTWSNVNLGRASGGSHWRNATAGSSAALAFEGSWVSLGFIADPFSGEAEIFIDGVSQGLVDLYRNEETPVSYLFDGLSAGPHTVVIEVLGSANPFASNTSIQLDYADHGDGSLLPDGAFEEDDARLLTSSGWTTTSYAGASGGSYLNATTGTAWFPFAGDSFTLHAIAHSNAGKAQLFVDGVQLDTIDLFEPVFPSAGVTRSFSYEGLGAGPHVLQIMNYQAQLSIDALSTPGSGPFIDPDPPIAGVTRFEADHPAIRYNGLPFTHTASSWVRVANITADRASAGEYIYSASAGDSISFDFEGDWLGVGFATDRFGGQAEIAIDGKPVETVDLYSRFEDTASHYFRDLGAGPHIVTITVLGSSHPNASGTRVHLDFFDVWDGQALAEGTFEEDSERLFYSSAWSRIPDSNASGGAYRSSGNANTTVWFPFTGDSVTWQGWTRFSFQEAEIRLNGASLGQFDLYSYDEGTRAYSFDNLGPGPHVLELRRYRSDTVTVDAFMTPATGPGHQPPAPVPFVRHEEDHPAMRYNGESYRRMPQSWALQSSVQNSASYNLSSSTAGDVWSLDFEGRWLNIGFRSSVTSGTVEVFVDGASRGLFDTSGGVNSVRNVTFGDLAPGAHSVDVVVVSGTVTPDYMDVWDGQAVNDGWYDARLESEASGLLHFSRKQWWRKTSDVYARDGEYLNPFASSNNNIWFNFTGTDLTVLGYQREGSSLQVVIDGVDQGVFDMSPPAPFRNQPFALHFPDLGEGAHAVQVFVPALAGLTSRIDAFEVNPDALVSYMPEVKWYDTAPSAVGSDPDYFNVGLMSSIAIGDLNSNGVIELVAPSTNGTLYVYRGDGQDAGGGSPLIWSTDAVGVAAEPALADLTGDGNAEIVISGSNGTFAFAHDGTALWHNPDVKAFTTDAGGATGWGGPALANLDQSPEPEIVIAASEDALHVLDHDGNTLWSEPIGRWPTVPVLADITGDGMLDIVVAQGWSLRVYDYANGGQQVWQYTQPDQASGTGAFGAPAVADLTGDGQPEIIINWGPVVEAIRADGSLLWRYEPGQAGLFRPSPVTVADVNGDGQMNIVTASAISSGFVVLSHLLMVVDAQGNLVWSQNVGDTTSSASGVAAQDLTGDGAWEIIWNGSQDGLLILRGSDGKRLFNEPYVGSDTVMEYPTLGDVDGDGVADIVLGGREGIFVISHVGRWADSRPLWNQHNYHVTNINNDWSVPFIEEDSWALHNTYRTQTPDRDPGCASEDGNLIPPRFGELSPLSGSVLPAGVPLVIGGRAIPVNAAQPVLEVLLDDRNAVLDASGSFFAVVELESGPNQLSVTARDRCGSAEITVELSGGGSALDPWSSLGDASVLLEARFTGTTHDLANERLLVDLQALNGGDALPGPVLMAIGGDADAALGLLNADGFTPQGEPYVVVVPEGEQLASGALSVVRALALANPQRASIDFTPRWFAPVNQSPYFTSIPNTRATPGQPWTYAITTADGNGDPISLALLAAPPGMDLQADALTWTPAQTGNFEVMLQAADGRGGTARQGFTLRVEDGSFNSPPVFTSTPPVQVPIGAIYIYDAVAVDLDGDALSFGLQAAPAGAQVDPLSGQVSWTQAQPGQHSLVLVVDDGRGGQASQAWTLYVGEPAGAPSGPAFSSVPLTFAAVGVQYRYVYSLTYSQTDAPVVSLLQAPAAMQLDASAGVISWVPGGADLGPHVVELRAIDSSGLEATQRFDLQVLANLPNQPPYIVSTPVPSARMGVPYSYAAEAVDPEFEALVWSLPVSPAGMTVDPVSGVIDWVPNASHPAEVPVTLQVSDPHGAVATQDFVIRLRAANSAPVISANPPTSVRVGEFYSTRILASDADSDPLQFRLLQGPPGMTLHASMGWLHWATSGSAPGTYPIELEVTDGWGGRAVFAFSLELLVDDQAPVASIRMLRDPACRAEPVNVCVEASDNVGVSSVGLVIDGQARALDAARCHLWTPAAAGLFAASAEAVDPSGLVGSDIATLTVADCNDEEAPVVALISPLPDSAHNLPVPIVVSIEDNTPEVLTWTVSLSREAGGDAELLASGSGPVTEAEVAVFDPTGLAPGTYYIDILGNDGAQTGGIRFRLNSGEGFKPGRVKFASADVTLPVAGIPLAIGRVYDSLDAGQHGSSSGDFGPGWGLLLSASVSDSAADAPAGASGIGGLFAAEPFSSLTRIHVIKPNGERVGFTFDPRLKSFPAVFQYEVRFRPDPGVTDRLRAVGWPDVVWSLGAGFADFIIPYNPSRYELETIEGVVYLIDEVDGLLEIRDALGGVLNVTPDGLQSSWGPSVDYVRDGAGRIIEILLPAEPGEPAARLQYGYDATGNLVSATDLAGNVSTFVYGDPDHPHHLTELLDPLGNPLARHVFDADGRLIAHCPADGNITTLEGCSQFSFDADGGVQTIFDPRGFRSDLFYDARGLLTVRRDWHDDDNWFEQQWLYDDDGRVLEYLDGDGGLTRSEFDVDGNETLRVLPGGEAWSFEYAACRAEWTRHCDGLGNCYRREFDDDCRLIEVEDPLGGLTRYSYDSRGLRNGVIDPLGQTWSFERDGRGLLSRVTVPGGGEVSIQSDALGNATRIENRDGSVREFVYDEGGRLIEERWPGVGTVASWEYNGNGLETRAESGDSQLDYTYWPTGRVRRVEHSTAGAPPWWVEYDYDGSGNVEQVRDSAGGVTDHHYNGVNQLVSIRQQGAGVLPKRVDFDVSATGLPIQMRRYADLAATQPGPVTEYGFGCLSCPGSLQFIEHRNAAGGVIHRLDYSRNAAFQIVSMDDADGAHAYTLDGRGWLVESSHPPALGPISGVADWDAAGNWLSRPGQAGPAQLSYAQGQGGHRLLAAGDHVYVYSAMGDLLTRVHGPSGETLTLDHERWSRVSGVRLADAMGQTISEANYGFAMNGWRISALRDGVQRHYVHDGPNATVGLDDAGNAVWRRLHTRSVDRPLAEERDGQIRWLLSDHVGSVRDVVDHDGQLLARYSYDPFGRQVSGPAPTLDDSVRFTGREFDLPGGLGFYRARVYDPAIGRFVSEDPRAPWHYAYAENNPLVLVDPSGESAAIEYAMIVCTVSATVFMIRPWAQFVDSALTQAANGLQGLPASAGAAIAPLQPNWTDPAGGFVPCGAGGAAGAGGG